MTFVGFLLLALQVVILIYYDPYYDAAQMPDAIPTWVWVFSMFAQFFSHTLGENFALVILSVKCVTCIFVNYEGQKNI